jgi:predicted XRE-type DNA-binding protein
MRRDTANLKAPDPEAVDLGPDNIFAQMGEPDAEERLLKTTLVSRLRAAIADRKLTQIKAGEVLGIPQPKVWELVSGGASGFSAERLIHLLNKVGVSVSLAFREEPDWRPGETFIHFDREPVARTDDASQRLLERLQTGWSPRAEEIDAAVPQQDALNWSWWAFEHRGEWWLGIKFRNERGGIELYPDVLFVDPYFDFALTATGFLWLYDDEESDKVRYLGG